MRLGSRYLFLAIFPLLALALACGGPGDPDEVSVVDIERAARLAGFASQRTTPLVVVEKNDLELKLTQVTPKQKRVGDRFQIRFSVGHLSPTDPIEFSAVLTLTGPLVSGFQALHVDQTLKPATATAGGALLTCTDVGPGTYSIVLVAESDIDGIYELEATADVECVRPAAAATVDPFATATSPPKATVPPETETPVLLILAGGIRYPSAQFEQDEAFWKSKNGVPVYGFDDSGIVFSRDVGTNDEPIEELTGLEPTEVQITVGLLDTFCDTAVFLIATSTDAGEESNYPLLSFCEPYIDSSAAEDGGELVADPTEAFPTEADPEFVPESPGSDVVILDIPDEPWLFEKGLSLAVLVEPGTTRIPINVPITVFVQIINRTAEYDPEDAIDISVALDLIINSPQSAIEIVETSGLDAGGESLWGPSPSDRVILGVGQSMQGTAILLCTKEDPDGFIDVNAMSDRLFGVHYADSREERIPIRCDDPEQG